MLLAMARQRQKLDADLGAVHFVHGLHPDSAAWKEHCRALCERLDVPLTTHDLALTPGMPNLESQARDLRYRWVAERIDQDTIYLTAHHQDDRAETLLLNALRGSGLDGMAGIPETRPLGKGLVARPLLGFSREALVEYLRKKDVKWVEDPSNQESHQDRNFIRNKVMPVLESRWPAARQSLARTSRHLQGASQVMKDLLDQDAEPAQHCSFVLPVEVLGRLSGEAPGYVLRAWLRRNGTAPVPESRLSEFLGQLAASTHQSRCEMSWPGWSVRLFRQELWLVAQDECPECPEFEWTGDSDLELGEALGTLELGGEAASTPRQWTVGPRRAGSRMRIHEGGSNRKLKKLMSEQPIPPWQRKSIPILSRGGEIMAIGDWQLAPALAGWLEENNLRYCWRPGSRGLRETRRRCHELSRPRQSA